jgi:hypothetical protein
VQHQRFTSREGISADGVFGKLPPPWPDFSMKGRSVSSILRLVEQWHRQLGQEEDAAGLSWRAAPLKSFQFVEGSEALGNMRVWTITELLNSHDLFLEGQAMHHCVATYARLCAQQRTSIWSMQLETRRGRNRVLTIEVDPAKRTICQARRKCNRPPQAQDREIVERWATRERFKIEKWS